MKLTTKATVIIALAALAQSAAVGARPMVTAPPDSFFEKVRERDRDAARRFYRKYTDVGGLPVAAAAEVSDVALQRTCEIVTHMLAGRPDILDAMVERGMYLVILGKDQVYTDLPENRNARNPDYLNERVLGRQASDEALLKANDTIRKMFAYRHDILKALIADGVKLVVLGPAETLSDLPEYNKMNAASADHTARFLDYSPETKLLVVAQENVLADLAEPYATECQVMRVFARALYHVTARRPVDPNWEDRGRNVQQYELRVQRMDIRFDKKLEELYDSAIDRGQWKGTAAVHDRVEYWTQGVLGYFDAVGQGAVPNDADHPITTRESLRDYDPGLFALVEETMAYKGKVDWRYR